MDKADVYRNLYSKTNLNYTEYTEKVTLVHRTFEKHFYGRLPKNLQVIDVIHSTSI